MEDVENAFIGAGGAVPYQELFWPEGWEGSEIQIENGEAHHKGTIGKHWPIIIILRPFRRQL